jgi:hypothetical protein
VVWIAKVGKRKESGKGEERAEAETEAEVAAA